MIKRLSESSGSAVGYAFSGKIDKQDYEVLVPDMERLVEQYGTVQVLCDLQDFTSESPSAWSDDWRFGREFHEKITKMAIVGDSKWLGLLSDLAKPLYAKSVKHFEDSDAAWEWLRAAD